MLGRMKKGGSEDPRGDRSSHEIKDAKSVAAKRAEELLKQSEHAKEKDSSPKDSESGTVRGDHKLGEENEKLRKSLEELLELKDKWLRQAADFENAKKRLQREKEDFVRFTHINFFKAMLPIIQNLDRAVHHGQGQLQQKDPLVEGVELVIKQFERFLESHGVKRIETLGKIFDPHLHEAVNHVPSDQAQEMIIEETEPGYLYHDYLIKPAKVVVSQGKATNLEPVKPQDLTDEGEKGEREDDELT